MGTRLRDEVRSLFSDSTVNRMVRDNGWLFGSNAIGIVTGFVTGVLVARMLGIVSFGTVAIIVNLVMIVNALLSFRMREFVVRYLSGSAARDDSSIAKASAKAALMTEALMSVTAFALVYLLAPWASKTFLPSGVGPDLIRIYGFVILSNLVAESTKGILQSFGNFQRMAVAGTAEQIVKLAGVILLFVSDGDARGVLLVYVAAQTTGCAVIAWSGLRSMARRFGSSWWRVSLSVLKPSSREMISFALNTNLGSTLALVAKRIDLLFLGAFVGSAEAGYFGLAQSLVGISFLPVASLTDPFYPVVAREVEKGDAKEVRRLIGSGTKVSLLWILPCGVVALSSIWFLVPLVYGDGFGPAALAFALMWPGAAWAQALFWARPTLLALGRPGYGNIVTAVLSAVKIGLLFLLIPPFGYVACASILSVFAICNSGMMGRKVLRLLDELQQGRGAVATATVVTPPKASTVGMP